MGYASVAEVDALLAQALTSARPTSDTQKIKLINVGDVRDTNRIANDVVEFYISLADSQIDGILTEMYEVPLKKCAHGEWRLEVDLESAHNSGTDQVVEITNATNLVPGDEIILHNGVTADEEHHVVKEVLDQYSFTLYDHTDSFFSAATTRVIRIAFPPPINQISARYACSFIYDKYFSAQNSPNVSDYGKELRKIAMQQLNDILNGRVILREPCTRRIGDRFGNAYLDSGYSLYSGVGGFQVQDRNMSNL